jgi:glycosyltransferase involved in cell wall biosynthesis
MKIVQSTFGVFHHFELARELQRRGHLERIVSTFPWKRLAREEIPREKVETFPWVQTPQLLLHRLVTVPPPLGAAIGYRNALLFDRWLDRRIPACDALIALSGSSLQTGIHLQQRGGVFVCDRGSTHRSHQAAVIAEEHRLWKLPYRLEERREMERELAIYRQADAIVVPSQAARRTFLDRGHDPGKVHAIPYGVLLDRFKPVGDPPRDRFEVLFAGGVSLRKGIPYLLQAFAKLRHPHKRLRIAGGVDPALRPLLATLAQQQVEFLGPIPQSELPALMSSSHVLVLPSVEEGLALVQGQALACGCPVIATEATGAEDLFTDGVEGFILPIRSPGPIAERLQQLADDPALRARMSVAALARVQHLGGWRQFGDRWEALLRALISASAR